MLVNKLPSSSSFTAFVLMNLPAPLPPPPPRRVRRHRRRLPMAGALSFSVPLSLLSQHRALAWPPRSGKGDRLPRALTSVLDPPPLACMHTGGLSATNSACRVPSAHYALLHPRDLICCSSMRALRGSRIRTLRAGATACIHLYIQTTRVFCHIHKCIMGVTYMNCVRTYKICARK